MFRHPALLYRYTTSRPAGEEVPPPDQQPFPPNWDFPNTHPVAIPIAPLGGDDENVIGNFDPATFDASLRTLGMAREDPSITAVMSAVPTSGGKGGPVAAEVHIQTLDGTTVVVQREPGIVRLDDLHAEAAKTHPQLVGGRAFELVGVDGAMAESQMDNRFVSERFVEVPVPNREVPCNNADFCDCWIGGGDRCQANYCFLKPSRRAPNNRRCCGDIFMAPPGPGWPCKYLLSFARWPETYHVYRLAQPRSAAGQSLRQIAAVQPDGLAKNRLLAVLNAARTASVVCNAEEPTRLTAVFT